MSSNPFEIAVSDAELDRLRQKLDLTTLPDELDNAAWDMGVPLDEIKRLTDYWRDGFDWRDQERKLNEQLKQFTISVSIDGFDDLEIHYLHHTSKTRGAIPLLFIHGWPGSFIEAIKLIPLLTSGDENKPAFDVVAPSLPNFGFSAAVKKRGFGLHQYAEAMHKVMIALGYEEYVTQGGDWGSIISRLMAVKYPSHTKAIHLNSMPVLPPMPWKDPLFFIKDILTIPFSAERKAYVSTAWNYIASGSGYMIQQATRPQTLGYGLHDSPVALLAWIYDKLHDWSDNYPWSDDEILTWVSIYVFSTAGPAASARIYFETGADGSSKKAMSMPAPASVNVGVAQFPTEVFRCPLSWTRLLGGDVARATKFDKGGHFAAWEVPDLLAGDLREMFGRDGKAFGAVKERNGYE